MMIKTLVCGAALAAAAAALPARGALLWDGFALLRDAMYNRAPDSEVRSRYEDAVREANGRFAGAELLVALSKCEYMMGRNALYAGRKDEAGDFFDKGAAAAKDAADAADLTEAWVMYAENVSQNCAVKSVSYALAQGGKIGGIASRALIADPSFGAAYVLSYAQHIYAPAPFHNYGKGIKNFKSVLAAAEKGAVILQKDDDFNVRSALAYGYLQQKNYAEAETWCESALEIYPSNAFVQDLRVLARQGKK